MTLPPDEATRRRIENLRAVLAGPDAAATGRAGLKPAAEDAAGRAPGGPGAGGGSGSAPGAAAAPGAAGAPSHRQRNSILGTLAGGVALVLGKLKVLAVLAGLLKLKTVLSIVISIALYATQWGLPFAAGFVLLILVHELGHAVVLHREGIPAGAPVFIPFLGAFIAMRGQPRNAYVEAKVGIGGPIAGSLAAWAVLAVGLFTHQPLLVALGRAGALLNLFNLIPVSPLDGGRIAGAFTHVFWIAGYAIGVLALVVTRSPLLLIVLGVGLITLWQRWRHPIPGYHDIPIAQRLAIGLGYVGLVIALTLTLPDGLALPAVPR